MRFLPIALSAFAGLLFNLNGLAQSPSKPLSFDEYKHTVKAVDLKSHKMSLEDFRKIAGKKNVYVLDLRSEREYNEGHIKGALHLGADAAEEKLQKLVPKKDATIVVYCTNTFLPTRMIALTYATLPQIVAQDYSHVFMLEELWQSDNHMGAFDKLKQDSLWETPAEAK